MKKSILTYLLNHPNSRRRAIAYDLKVWQCNVQFLAAMCELEQQGWIKSTYHTDPANMEFYDTFAISADREATVIWCLGQNFSDEDWERA